MTRQALGKGLSALLKDRQELSENEQRDLPINLLKPNRFQPRQSFSEQRLEELAESIRQHGFVQPIIVRKSGDHFQIIAGERRWRAAQRLGLDRVPVLVRSVSDEHLLEVSLIENIQRENLNPIEEAKAYHRLSHDFGLTQDEVAKRTGKNRSTITNLMRLLKLAPEIQQLVIEEQLSMGHARALLSLDDPDNQRSIAQKSVQNSWSVRQIERFISSFSRQKVALKKKKVDPNVRAAVERLERALGTRVRIVEKGRRGRIEIDYVTTDDLHRLYERLVGQSEQNSG
jgi:ParB family chromosome partitioning protein